MPPAMRQDPRSAETQQKVQGILREAQTGRNSQQDPNAEMKMETIWLYLKAQDIPHWYCSRASETTRECAIYLQKLHGYASAAVQTWKSLLLKIIYGCCECAQEYEFSKRRSREVYLAAFGDQILDTFFRTVNQWEQESVVKVLKAAEIPQQETLNFSDAPSGILFHILNNPALCIESNDVSILFRRNITGVIQSLTTEPVPVGLLILAVDEDDKTRAWAQKQLAATKIDCGLMDFKTHQSPIIESLLDSCGNSSGTASLSPYFSSLAQAVNRWSCVASVVQSFPTPLIRDGVNARKFVDAFKRGMKLLHDAKEFQIGVLHFAQLCLHTHATEIWDNNPANYPDAVLTTLMKDGRLERLVCADITSDRESTRSLSWVAPFLVGIRDRAQFGTRLRVVFKYLVSLASNRQIAEHPRVLALRTIRDETLVLLRVEAQGESQIAKIRAQHLALRDAILEQKTSITEAAFQSTIPAIRDVARDLLQALFLHDIEALHSTRCAIVEARGLEGRKPEFADKLKEPVIHVSLWAEALQKIDHSDLSSVQFMVHIMARSAHIDALTLAATEVRNDHKMAVRTLAAFVNSSLRKIRMGFDEFMARFGLVCDARQLDSRMMADVITLLFSPVPELHSAALEIFGDCDGRKACLRFALSCQPQATLEGVMRFVDAFNGTAGKLVEACSVAKSLVRCLADVIEGLCGPERNGDEDGADAKVEDDLDGDSNEAAGLLEDSSFDPQARNMLRPLWKSMCRALALIFAKCPSWAEFFEPQEMVEWMRDALIFGRLMRAHVSSFQPTIDSEPLDSSWSKPSKLESMRAVQQELVAWFRLTDEELLYQAYELMMSFLEGGIVPPPEGRAKLGRYVITAKFPVPKVEALEVVLGRFPQPEQDAQSKAQKESTKLGKRKRSQEPEDSKTGIRTSKSSHHDAVVISSDDDSSAGPSSRSASRSKLEQSFLNKFMKDGARNKPAKTSTKSKIHISTVKPPQPKAVVSTLGSGPLAKMRAQATAHKRQTTAQKAEVQMRNLAKAAAGPVRPSGSSSRAASSASSAHEIDTDTSSSSSSDEEDIKKTTLASLAPTVIPKKPDQPKRTMVMLDGPPVLTAQQRRLQDLKRRHDDLQRRTARLKPNLEGLHEQILRWSIDHDGPQPLSIGGTNPKLNRVLPKFPSKKDYFDIFHPLLVNECWNQVLHAKEEGPKDSVACAIMTRSYIDNFTEIAFNIVEKMPERWFLAETDIVLLRSAEGDRSILAKITSFKRGHMANQIASGTMRLSAPVEQIVKVQTQERWQMSKIYSLSTINREYAALTTAEYYDLFDEVLTARSASRSVPSEQRVKDTMHAHRLNEPQAKAILSALSTSGFSLIQGPPGTGKTSTICGLAGAFVSAIKSALPAPNDKEKKDKRRLLVCAPSNAAIDEITKRLVDGVRDDKGQPLGLKVVRIGNESSMNVSVSANSLDSLVDEKMAGMPKTASSPATDMAALRQELADVKQKIDAKRNELDEAPPGQRRITLENEFRALKTQRTNITGKLDTARDQQKNASRVLDAARRKFRNEVLSEADVICSTLSGAGHEVLEPFEFETVIIDEAAQAIEIATLIPLRYGCKTCILVGDPQQLPPTVISQLASGLDYNQSLFVRLQRQNPDSVHLLSIQYRMHPTISAVPSRLFYHGRLQDGPDMAQRTQQPWHASSLFGPYQFFDVAHGQEQAQSNHSQINREEADAALALFDRLRREFDNTKFDYRIGIVSMYHGQVLHMKSRFQAVHGPGILKLIDFNTVDGFQGQEKDIIILSCVRAGMNVQSVGFLADERRMNVALTRSRSSLFILGHAATLERCNQTWRTIVEDARERDCLLKCSKEFFRSAPSSAPQQKPIPARPATKKVVKSKPVDIMDLVPAQSKRPGMDTTSTKAPVALSASHKARVVSATMSSRSVDDAASVDKPIPPAIIPTRPSGPSLPPKPVPSTSNNPQPRGIAALPPKPAAATNPAAPVNIAAPVKPPPPRKKAAASAFIPKAKQKKTQLGGP